MGNNNNNNNNIYIYIINALVDTPNQPTLTSRIRRMRTFAWPQVTFVGTGKPNLLRPIRPGFASDEPPTHRLVIPYRWCPPQV